VDAPSKFIAMPSVSALASFALTHRLPQPRLTTAANGDEQEYLYSADETKRYAYRQTWNQEAPHVLWVMLNPGTGETEMRRRNTLERCVKWSMQWGFGGLYFGNVFSERTKSAKQLVSLATSQDELNEQAVRFLCTLSKEVVVAWGAFGSRLNRAAVVASLIPEAKCLGLTKSGQPRHPLYVASAFLPHPWPPTGVSLSG
jgi:hypothetical protein